MPLAELPSGDGDGDRKPVADEFEVQEPVAESHRILLTHRHPLEDAGPDRVPERDPVAH